MLFNKRDTENKSNNESNQADLREADKELRKLTKQYQTKVETGKKTAWRCAVQQQNARKNVTFIILYLNDHGHSNKH